MSWCNYCARDKCGRTNKKIYIYIYIYIYIPTDGENVKQSFGPAGRTQSAQPAGKNRRGAPGIHCSGRQLPGFSGELGNYCDTSLCCTTVHYCIMRVVTSTCSLVRSTKPCPVLSVWHWWHYSTSTHICMATGRYSKYTCMHLTICIHASH